MPPRRLPDQPLEHKNELGGVVGGLALLADARDRREALDSLEPTTHGWTAAE